MSIEGGVVQKVFVAVKSLSSVNLTNRLANVTNTLTVFENEEDDKKFVEEMTRKGEVGDFGVIVTHVFSSFEEYEEGFRKDELRKLL